MDYDYRDIEQKWQQYWKENNTYKVEIDSSKPKCYVLVMFPYPSGAGLHIGHPLSYTAADIYARYKRLKGFNVLHPMGFDAFGLPAEQYAIETGQHPRKTTLENIENFKVQLNSLGLSYDWDREVKTCDPEYYKWTQWIFLKLFNAWYNRKAQKAESIETLVSTFESEGNLNLEDTSTPCPKFTAEEWMSKGEKERQEILLNYRLAYLAYADVNWCAELGTVLANDEVKDGVSERGGYPVEKIKMRQWFLRITEYSERLLSGLDGVDFSEAMKDMQRNWIGRSEGASVWFKIAESEKQFEIFTTRPDTIFGATFMVLAPEHELIEEITTTDQKEAIDKYLAYVKSRTDVERQQEKAVTGEFTGAYALNPFNGEKIPIYIAEYVLAGYGTGAIMAVPSDDVRDQAFAEKFGLPIIEVIDREGIDGAEIEDKRGKLINSDFLNGMEIKEAIQAINKKIEELGIGIAKVNYKLRDAGFSRQRYWGEPFPVVFKDDLPVALGEDELPLLLPEVNTYEPTGDGKGPLASNADWINAEGGTRESDTMPGYAGSSWYWQRYMDPQNRNEFVSQEAEQYWQDVDLYIGGSEHAVGHLMYSRFWNQFLYDLGLVSVKEPFKKLVNQGMIQGRSSIVYRVNGTNKFVSHGLKDDYDVTELRVDINIVENDELNIEAFKSWREEYADAELELEDGKYICGWEIEKMSKRWHNVVNPNDIVHNYGADILRLYIMFLGPIEQSKPWITNGIDGVSKFVRKFWRLFFDESNNWRVSDEVANEAEVKLLHKTIKKVGEDIERLSFNTAVSQLMICVNELTSLKSHKQEILEKLVVIIAPLAPHLAEELWKRLGNTTSVTETEFPVCDEQYLKEDSYEYPVSINGKMRAKLKFPLDAEQQKVEEEVLASEKVQKWLEGKSPKKIIYVKGRIINVVV